MLDRSTSSPYFGWAIVALATLIPFGGSQLASGQVNPELKVAESIDVLNEIMQVSASSIPRAMLADAHAVAIIPRAIKGSFIVGARRGEGVVLVRDAQGNWQAPAFVTLTGGNVGWQVGIQSTDVVLVFKTRTSVEHMLAGAFTIGADASAAAGPVGRDAAVATDSQLKAEVYSYSRSRGLFAGVSIDGSVLKINQGVTAAYYNSTNTGQPNQVPPSATQLVQTLRTYTGELASGRGEPIIAANTSVQTNGSTPILSGNAESIQRQLVQAAPSLYKMLDPSWQSYLALPAEVIAGNGRPSDQKLAECIGRFEFVRSGSQYSQLIERPEFQNVLDLLKQYQSALVHGPTVLGLPSPPNASQSNN